MATATSPRRRAVSRPVFTDRYAVLIVKDGKPVGELGVGIRFATAHRIASKYNKPPFGVESRAVIHKLSIKVLGTFPKARRKAVSA